MLSWAAKSAVWCLKIAQLRRLALWWCSTDFRSAKVRSAAWYVLLSKKLENLSWRHFETFFDAWNESPSCQIWGRWPPKDPFFSQEAVAGDPGETGEQKFLWGLSNIVPDMYPPKQMVPGSLRAAQTALAHSRPLKIWAWWAASAKAVLEDGLCPC